MGRGKTKFYFFSPKINRLHQKGLFSLFQYSGFYEIELRHQRVE